MKVADIIKRLKDCYFCKGGAKIWVESKRSYYIFVCKSCADRIEKVRKKWKGEIPK